MTFVIPLFEIGHLMRGDEGLFLGMKRCFFLLVIYCYMGGAHSDADMGVHVSVSAGADADANGVTDTLQYPGLVRAFYNRKQAASFWFAPGVDAAGLRERLWQYIDSARYSGLDRNRFHYLTIFNSRGEVTGRMTDGPAIGRLEQIFTDAALALCLDLYQGRDISDRLRYDELSGRSADSANQLVLSQLTGVTTAAGLTELLARLEPKTREYVYLKQALARELDSAGSSPRIRKLASSLDYYRWVNHFALHHYILINIAAATLRYYDHDSLLLTMKVVAGKPSTPTPRFSARCTEVTLYPYWNVPRRIAVRELLPVFKTSPALVEEMGMQLLSADGSIVDYQGLPWRTFTAANFPYRVRQVTGCGNALGVIKFGLTDPFDVYMHDTNLKAGFASPSRYYSHGCIRLEKPFLLAMQLMGDALDTTLLAQCLRDQEPRQVTLSKPVPVLVVYITAEPQEDGQLIWYKDIYHLLAKKNKP
jgi:murein L,D-transpeptidase YcbB/YkuD